jgi:AcrR family transcriptional regulator
MELKERIIEEAAVLFSQNGVRSITMSDIASHLGISKRTLYEVFNDKEDLLEACINRTAKRANEEMKQLVAESENVIEAVMRIYAKHLNDKHKRNRIIIHDLRKYHPRLYQNLDCRQKEETNMFIPLFEKGIKQGLLRNDINFEIVTWLLKAQFKMVMEGDFLPTDKYSIDDFISAIILNFARGIASPKGYELIDEMVMKLDKTQ